MENQLSIVLSRNKLLKNVDIKKIDFSRIRGKLFTISEGEILYREGDPADIIYLVVSGEINLLKKRMLGKPKSYIFTEDDFLGNDEFFEEMSRYSTAVALRDSYIIALAKSEIENLIEQDSTVFNNLREPASELDGDLPKTSSDIKIDDDSKIILKDADFTESEKTQEEDDFFKSIADTTHSNKSELFKPIEPITNDEIIDSDPEKRAGLNFEDAFLNEDGIPKAEVDLTQMEGLTNLEEPKANLPKEDFQFSEQSFLDEDGIPKPEFELPEISSASPQADTKYDELDEALFSMLSGEEPPKIDKIPESSISINENDNSFFNSLADEEHEKKVEKDLFFAKVEETTEQVQPEKLFEPEEKIKVSESSNKSIIDFETEEIFAEADKNLQEMSQTEKNGIKMPTVKEGDEMGKDQLQMIIKAAELVNSTIQIDEVLKNIVEVATDLTSAERGTLYLVDREKGELWSLIAMGSERKEIRVKLGEGLSGFVAKTGEILNIKDARRDPRWRSDFDKTSGFVTKTALNFPIKNKKEEIIGVLQLLNSRNGEFSQIDEELLNAMSIHAALALQNAEMLEKLLQSERVQSLGKMANFLIQDIKKPILVSKRYVEHLKSKSLPPDNAQIVDMLLEQLTQVADLVQTTSSYSEGKTILRTLNVSLNNTLADYASRINAYVESRKCQIISEFDKDVTVKLDVKEFYQCFMHLVKNACDAMPEGGNIYVSTKRDEKEKKVKLFFRDNGLGIAESLKEKIFEPFFTQGKKEGAGLGLSITKKVVEGHNGSIDVKSALGEGATFMINLPTASSI